MSDIQTSIERIDKPVEQKKPRCPYCNARPCPLFMNLVAFNGAPAVVFACGNCEKILGVSAVPGESPQHSTKPVSLIHTM